MTIWANASFFTYISAHCIGERREDEARAAQQEQFDISTAGYSLKARLAAQDAAERPTPGVATAAGVPSGARPGDNSGDRSDREDDVEEEVLRADNPLYVVVRRNGEEFTRYHKTVEIPADFVAPVLPYRTTIEATGWVQTCAEQHTLVRDGVRIVDPTIGPVLSPQALSFLKHHPEHKVLFEMVPSLMAAHATVNGLHSALFSIPRDQIDLPPCMSLEAVQQDGECDLHDDMSACCEADCPVYRETERRFDNATLYDIRAARWDETVTQVNIPKRTPVLRVTYPTDPGHLFSCRTHEFIRSQTYVQEELGNNLHLLSDPMVRKMFTTMLNLNVSTTRAFDHIFRILFDVTGKTQEDGKEHKFFGGLVSYPVFKGGIDLQTFRPLTKAQAAGLMAHRADTDPSDEVKALRSLRFNEDTQALGGLKRARDPDLEDTGTDEEEDVEIKGRKKRRRLKEDEDARAKQVNRPWQGGDPAAG